jgi:hypothetical protein
MAATGMAIANTAARTIRTPIHRLTIAPSSHDNLNRHSNEASTREQTASDHGHYDVQAPSPIRG